MRVYDKREARVTTTITPATVTAVTTGGLAVELGQIATLILIALLVAREIVGAISGERAARWTRDFGIGIAPLGFVFAVIVVVKVVHVV